MPGPNCVASSPASFTLARKNSGTAIAAVLDIWANVGTPQQICLAHVTLPNSGGNETETISLPVGNYVVVVRIYIHTSLNPYFNYALLCGSQVEFSENGTIPSAANGAIGRTDQFNLRVQ